MSMSILEYDVEKQIGFARREGEKKRALEIAESFLDVLDIPTIAAKTGLTEEEVKALTKK